MSPFTAGVARSSISRKIPYLQVTAIETHSVDLPTVWPARVHPVDEFLLVVKVDVDDVVEALRINSKCKMMSLLDKKRQKENEEIQFPERENLWHFFFFPHGVILEVVSLCKAKK